MKDYKREIYTDNRGKFRWRVTAKNGQIVDSSSQGFATVEICMKNIELVHDATDPAHGDWTLVT